VRASIANAFLMAIFLAAVNPMVSKTRDGKQGVGCAVIGWGVWIQAQMNGMHMFEVGSCTEFGGTMGSVLYM
jgi:hypothetical protein